MQAQVVPARAVPVARAVAARVASVPAFPVREALVREAALPRPARAGRARVRRTGGRRRLAGPVRPDTPEPKGQAGLRRYVSTRPLGRASRRPTDVTGPDRRRSHRAR
ncbi:MAG TPA: hypothetical protein VFX25_39980 [Streptosporangiaceae bacterium]|nr:hypothetical protein [Streptosporangiaceae bacterium]